MSCFVSLGRILFPLHEKPSLSHSPFLPRGEICVWKCSLIPTLHETFPPHFYMLLVPNTMNLLFTVIAWTRHAYDKFKHYLHIYNKNRVLSSLPPVNHLVCLLPVQFLFLNTHPFIGIDHRLHESKRPTVSQYRDTKTQQHIWLSWKITKSIDLRRRSVQDSGSLLCP